MVEQSELVGSLHSAGLRVDADGQPRSATLGDHQGRHADRTEANHGDGVSAGELPRRTASYAVPTPQEIKQPSR